MVGFVVLLLLGGGAKYAVDLEQERSVAVAARAEAEERHSQAEGLIEFMLGDLRGKLEPVGRLDVLDDVGEKALEYYRATEGAALDSGLLDQIDVTVRRAMALRQIGEVRAAQGQHEQAILAFTQAREILDEARKREPDHEQALYELAQVHFWIADAHFSRNQLGAAEDQIKIYRDLGWRLADLYPDNPRYRLEAAYAESNLGTLALRSNRVDLARTRFTRNLEVLQEMVEANPDDAALKADLALTMSWLGSVERSSLDLRQAARWHEQELAIRQEISQGGGDKRALEHVAIAQQLLADSPAATGRG